MVVSSILAPIERGELAIENAVDVGPQLLDEAHGVWILGDEDRYVVQIVIGGKRRLDVGLRYGMSESSIGCTHCRDVVGRHRWYCGGQRQTVQRAQNIESVLDVFPVQYGDSGVGSGFRFNQASVSEACQGLADRRSTEP